jgi:hypothetical protein
MIARMVHVGARTFIVWVALVSSVVGDARAQPQRAEAVRRITLGVFEPADWTRDSTNASSIRGMTLGIEEGQRTAAMFGWELVVKKSADSLSAASALHALARGGATAIVGDFSGFANALGPALDVSLILDIGSQPEGETLACNDTRFRIVPAAAVTHRTWHQALERYGAGQLNERYRRRFEAEMDDRAWASWMAVKILVDAALKTGNSDPRALENYLIQSGRFDGHKGVPLFFDAETRELVQPLVAVVENGEPELVGSHPRVSSQPAVSTKCSGE